MDGEIRKYLAEFISIVKYKTDITREDFYKLRTLSAKIILLSNPKGKSDKMIIKLVAIITNYYWIIYTAQERSKNLKKKLQIIVSIKN